MITDRIVVTDNPTTLSTRPLGTRGITLSTASVLVAVQRPDGDCDVYTAGERYLTRSSVATLLAGGLGFRDGGDGLSVPCALGRRTRSVSRGPGGGVAIAYGAEVPGGTVPATVEFPPVTD